MRIKFTTYSGELFVDDNLLQINDNHPRWIKFVTLFSSFGAILYGALVIIRYFKSNDPFDLWQGIIIVALGIPALMVQSRITYDEKINFIDIVRVNIKTNLANHLLADFYLKNGKKRRVMLDQEELARFEKFSLDDFVRTLNSKNILTEFK